MPENKKVLSDVEKADRLNKLKILLKDDENLEKLQTEDKHLEKFLYSTDFDVQKAYNKMKNYYEMVQEYPDWFPVLGPLDKKAVIDKNIRIMLPQYDKEGRPIFIAKIGGMKANVCTNSGHWTVDGKAEKSPGGLQSVKGVYIRRNLYLRNGNTDMSTMKIMDIIAVDDIWLESALEDNPRIAQKGLCVIMDVADYPWKMLKWMTPEYIKLCVRKMVALPFKDYRFHLVNTSTVVHIAIKITWPILPAYIKDMVKFHFNDWESLYEHIDKDVLPPEYGGTYDVNYNEIYEQLYEKNEEILESKKFRRDVVFS